MNGVLVEDNCERDRQRHLIIAILLAKCSSWECRTPERQAKVEKIRYMQSQE